jgi:hypothetical protein
MANSLNIDGQSRQAAKSWIEIDSQNLTDIDALFRNLPKRVDQDKVWNTFWRTISKPLVKQAKANALAIGGSGQLARSIGYFRTKASKRYHGGYVGPRVKGAYGKKQKTDKSGKGLKGRKQYTKSGFYGAWVEYGSDVKFGGKGYGKDQPFMGDAWESKSKTVLLDGMKQAEIIFQKELAKDAKKLKKHGRLGY